MLNTSMGMDYQSPSRSGRGEKRHHGHPASRKVRACTSCRQQKLRCDALASASKTCSRCAANNITCYFSTDFERKKARSKAELYREIDALRHNMRPPSTPEQGRDGSSTLARAAESPVMFEETSNANATPKSKAVCEASTSTPESSFAAYDGPRPGAPLTTSSRTLDDVSIEAFKIKDCFALFFKHYHRTLPILDPSWDQDTFYALSPFVFWCIVVTGSRRYDLDPTILHRLAPGVGQMALRAMPQFSSYFPTTCGLVMLCVWPLPMKTMHEDPSLLYSGAAMQIALQHGLHLFPRSQTCERPARFRTVAHDASLARVWAYVEFVCHCTSWSTGSPPHFLNDALDYGYYTDDIVKSISPSTLWMQKFERLYTRAVIALSEITHSMDSDPGRGAVLSGMIKLFDEQILDISQKALGDISSKAPRATDKSSTDAPPMYPNSQIATIARIHLNAYHFLGTDPTIHSAELIELLHLAFRWIEQATVLDQTSDWALYSSETSFRQTVLVASIILRISHSHQLKAKVDLGASERNYFAAVKLLKRRSLQTGDVNAQLGRLFSELWHNNTCFKRPDGTYDSLYVRIRRRGVMGVAYDCVWPSSTEHRETACNHEGPFINNHTTRSDSSLAAGPGSGPGFTDQSLFEIPATAENDFLDLINGSSFDLLYNDFQWAQDDGFWT